jgi:hypothetical protein
MVPSVVTPVRRRRAGDVAASVVLLLLAYGAFLIGAVFALLGLSFLDTCPEGTCSVTAAVDVQFTTGIILAIAALAGTIVTVLLLVFRRRGWWVALVTLATMVVGWIVGFILFTAAVS